MPELRLIEVGLMDGDIRLVGVDAMKPVWEQMPADWLMFTVHELWGSYRVVRGLRTRPATDEADMSRPSARAN